MSLYKKVGSTLLSGVKMRVDKIIEIGGKVLKKVEQNGLLLEELGKIEKSIIKSEKPLQVITSSLPREVKNFDRVVVEEGNGFLTEVLSFKNDKGETLLKTINRSKEGGDSFFTMRKYHQQNMESEVIHTNKFKNRKLISSQQETMTKGLYGDSFTRTKVVKNNINGKASHDIHSIGEYKHGEPPKEFQFSFDRNSDGYISSKLNIEKSPENFEMDVYDKRYLPVMFNLNKSEVMRDLVKDEVTRNGFPLMPDFTTVKRFKEFEKFENEKLAVSGDKSQQKRFMGEFLIYRRAIEGNEVVPVYDIIPTLKMNRTINSKESMANNAAHEVCHMGQQRRFIPKEKVSSMPEPAKSWWEETIRNRREPKPNSAEALKIQQYKDIDDAYVKTEMDLFSERINKQEFDKKYDVDIMENDANKAGNRAADHYSNLFSKFFDEFMDADWRALGNSLF